MKALVLLFGDGNVDLIHNALDSIRWQQHNEINVSVLDVGNGIAVKDIVEIHYRDILPLFSFYTGNDRDLLVNKAVEYSNADFVVMLRDSDALMPTYLKDLSDWYEKNSNSYGYCHIANFDPLTQRTNGDVKLRSDTNYTHPMNCNNAIDMSQVSWRLDKMKQCGIAFFSGVTLCDNLFQQFYDQWGPCVFTGLFGQWTAKF